VPLWLIPEDVLSETQAGDALAALNAVSLVRFDNSGDGTPAVSLHRLVQEVMRGRLRVAGRFDETAAQAIRLVEQSFDTSDSFESASRNAAWLPQALGCLQFAPNTGSAAWHTLWTLNQVGDFRISRGELNPAREAFEFGAKIASASAEANPDSAAWQRDLSVSYNRMGNVLVEQGNLSEALKSYRNLLAITDRLAKADPNNAGWQRDLSVSYNKVGDVLVAQGNLPEALKSFQADLAIADRLAKADPNNAGWQRDLSVSYNKVGDVLVDQGNLPEALKSFQASLAIADRLAKADPNNAGWQRDVAMSYERLILIYLQTGEKEKAAQRLADGRNIMARLTALSPDNATWRNDLAWFDHYIGELEQPAAVAVTEAREERKRGLFGRLFGGKG
jgi:tetratricopeptide (TPR) repeat protein